MSDYVDKFDCNVFYEKFETARDDYKGQMEVWEETKLISFIDTDADVGLFPKSDIIVSYDMETSLPNVITERIYARNYKKLEWWRLRRHLLAKTSVIKQELGFNIQISFGMGYIDYIHYKEDWWKCALKAKCSH